MNKGDLMTKASTTGILFSLTLVLLTMPLAGASEKVAFKRHSQVIYGRKHGLAMTMDIFVPAENANGIGLVAAVSGGWFSGQASIKSAPGALPSFFGRQMDELMRRGYTVFAVVHGSQPKYTVPEILKDMHRAVRFVRYHANDYGVDPTRLGMFGGSAGGHLSLMQATAGDKGTPDAEDPVDRQSSRVQTVVAYFPPTDFLNYGEDNRYFDQHVKELLKGRNPFLAALDFRELDEEVNLYRHITDEKEIRRRVAEVSPINHVTADDPPTLIIHGDADKLVPIQQAKLMIAKFKEAKVTASLKVMPGKDHGWAAEEDEVKAFVQWFDQHLRKP